MSQSSHFDAVLHNPGFGLRPGTSSANLTWMLLPVETDYWEMVNVARSLLVEKQTLTARVGMMPWSTVLAYNRSQLVSFIRARGMRTIVLQGPFSGKPWLGKSYHPPFTRPCLCAQT